MLLTTGSVSIMVGREEWSWFVWEYSQRADGQVKTSAKGLRELLTHWTSVREYRTLLCEGWRQHGKTSNTWCWYWYSTTLAMSVLYWYVTINRDRRTNVFSFPNIQLVHCAPVTRQPNQPVSPVSSISLSPCAPYDVIQNFDRERPTKI